MPSEAMVATPLSTFIATRAVFERLGACSETLGGSRSPTNSSSPYVSSLSEPEGKGHIKVVKVDKIISLWLSCQNNQCQIIKTTSKSILVYIYIYIYRHLAYTCISYMEAWCQFIYITFIYVPYIDNISVCTHMYVLYNTLRHSYRPVCITTCVCIYTCNDAHV